ncbi:MAG: hypothetical protein ACREAW_03730, partial [Nitrososphaera sp.]
MAVGFNLLHLDAHHDTPQHLMEYEVEMQKRRGDALSRFDVRVEEVINSAGMIGQIAAGLHSDSELVAADVREQIEPYSHALGYAESHRGQTMHWVMVGEDRDSLFRYK